MNLESCWPMVIHGKTAPSVQLLYAGGHARLTHFCWLDLAGCYRLVCIQAAAVAKIYAAPDHV